MYFVYVEELNSSTYKKYTKIRNPFAIEKSRKKRAFFGAPRHSAGRRRACDGAAGLSAGEWSKDIPDTSAAVDPNSIMKRIYIVINVVNCDSRTEKTHDLRSSSRVP